MHARPVSDLASSHEHTLRYRLGQMQLATGVPGIKECTYQNVFVVTRFSHGVDVEKMDKYLESDECDEGKTRVFGL